MLGARIALLVCFAVFFVCHADGQANPCEQVNIISRAEWEAREPKDIEILPGPVMYSFIHHTAMEQCFTQSDCSEMVRSIQNYHMDSNGWSDIGYSFLIGEDGNVYEGRGWDRVGAHTKGYNDVGLAFSIMGDFTKILPKQNALDLAQNMIACGLHLGKIESDYTLRGHRDMGSTACPGDDLYAEIKTWPHY
ncbi:peptidoglycan-recognition protein SC2-like [Amphiura filiformis]|uniref:peptidoglycan-recognition protein SC2-like n=1 Tax=Amphiura filiformis TaxID=82378 RepID=UPI003B222160